MTKSHLINQRGRVYTVFLQLRNSRLAKNLNMRKYIFEDIPQMFDTFCLTLYLFIAESFFEEGHTSKIFIAPMHTIDENEKKTFIKLCTNYFWVIALNFTHGKQ